MSVVCRAGSQKVVDDCPVCLEPLKKGITKLNCCKNASFHNECIDRCVKEHLNMLDHGKPKVPVCPVCRKPIEMRIIHRVRRDKIFEVASWILFFPIKLIAFIFSRCMEMYKASHSS